MSQQFIVMADVIRSRSYDGSDLIGEFARIVEDCNTAYAGAILSPYTITLGDEFQGVAGSLKNAVDSILFLEDRLLAARPAFNLRYVLVYGEIETIINPQIAHGMTGSGLALARELLTIKRRGRRRFQLNLSGLPCEDELNMLFRLLELISGHWKERDYTLIRELACNNDDVDVAAHFGKTKSQIWKRRKTLQIEEYVTIKELILRTVSHVEDFR